MQSVLILGRQPELGLAELESLYGASVMTLLNKKAVLVNVDPCVLAYDRLGGSIKFAKFLTTLETTDWKDIEDFLLQVSPEHVGSMPVGKMRLGISVIGFNLTIPRVTATALQVKKAIQTTGRNVRVIPNKELELNTAQVIHNQLTGPNGWDLNIIKSGTQTIIAQTIKVQDIEGYAHRDQQRPKRDSKVGMLPPKLAQIIVNCAVGKLSEAQRTNICDDPHENPPAKPTGTVLLDPFCGSGVILQEAYLQGYSVYGTDLEQRMADYTKENLDWLIKTFHLPERQFVIEPADATEFTWTQPVDYIASEIFLGRPLTKLPDRETMDKVVDVCSRILKKFLVNVRTQCKSGTRICIAVPAWQIRPDEFRRLPLIDQISDLGYNLVRFEHVGEGPLIYHRPGQIVGRELITLTVQ